MHLADLSFFLQFYVYNYVYDVLFYVNNFLRCLIDVYDERAEKPCLVWSP